MDHFRFNVCQSPLSWAVDIFEGDGNAFKSSKGIITFADRVCLFMSLRWLIYSTITALHINGETSRKKNSTKLSSKNCKWLKFWERSKCTFFFFFLATDVSHEKSIKCLPFSQICLPFFQTSHIIIFLLSRIFYIRFIEEKRLILCLWYKNFFLF